jgi:hypothetical protein
VAPITAATGELTEQYRRARSSERKTIDAPGLGLRRHLDGPTDTGRLRGDGNVKERAGSKHQRQRYHSSGNIHRQTISNRRLTGNLGPIQVTRNQRQTLQQNPDNAFIAAFNGRLRVECLNAHWGSSRLPTPGKRLRLGADTTMRIGHRMGRLATCHQKP